GQHRALDPFDRDSVVHCSDPSPTYLLRRLARSHPDILSRYESGGSRACGRRQRTLTGSGKEKAEAVHAGEGAALASAEGAQGRDQGAALRSRFRWRPGERSMTRAAGLTGSAVIGNADSDKNQVTADARLGIRSQNVSFGPKVARLL